MKSSNNFYFHVRWISLGFFILIAIVAIASAIFGVHKILGNNSCKMTYTTRERAQIQLQNYLGSVNHSTVSRILTATSRTPYRLWKISNPSSSHLNHQPVLFIPGHAANADVVRSFSSQMHDEEGYFQFFAVDFREELTMLHGSFVLNQANFVNLALRKIQRLYTKSSGRDDQKIMIVAHSAGGIVTRTAMLLSNHPKSCLVSNIILLSSPNKRSPLALDSSIDALYKAVNKAWLLSFYNTSRECLFQHSKKLEKDSKAPLTADFICPICVPRTRVISISGGEIDYQVPPDLTLLQDFTPRPRNRTLHKASTSVGSPTLSLLSTVNDYMKLVVMFPLRILISQNTAATPTNTSISNETIQSSALVSNETSIEMDEKVNVDALNSSDISQCNSTTSADETGAFNQSNDRPLFKDPVPVVSDDSWNSHMMPYIEPQFLSIRTYQLKEVAAPVDHLAILWCYQLVGTVLDGMRQLSIHDAADPNEGSEILSNAFPVKPEYRIDYNESSMLSGRNILPLERFLARNESSGLWHQAGTHELDAIQNKLAGVRVSTVALYFVTRKSVYVLSWYLVVGILMLTVPLLRSLCKHTASAKSPLDPLSNFYMLQPWVHFNLDVFFGSFTVFLRSWLPVRFSRAALGALIIMPAAVAAYCCVALYFQQWNPLSLAARLIFAYFAYSLALVVRAALVSVLYSMHSIVSTAVAILRIMLRYTIYCRPVRRFIRSSMKVLKTAVLKKTGFAEGQAGASTIATLIISATITLWISGMDRINGPAMHLGYMVYSMGVLSIVSYIAALVGIVLSLLLPPYRDADWLQYCHFVDFSLLYFPVLFLGRPTFLYSVHMILGDPGYASYTHHSSPDLSALFGPEQIHYCILMAAIAFHIWLARFKCYLKVFAASPISWMVDFYGPEQFVSVSDCFSFVIGSLKTIPVGYSIGRGGSSLRATATTAAAATVDGECVHEDGGLNALFEALNSPASKGLECVPIAPGVTLGSTYRVVWCSCATNLRLKDQSEWCEWCKCSRCGGKGQKWTQFAHSNNEQLVGVEINMDLVVVLSLYGLAFYALFFVEDYPFMYLNIAGGVAIAQLVRVVFPNFTFKL